MVAKPAEQTPRIAEAAVKLFYEAGLPRDALQLVQGDGKVGGELVADPRIAGVAFTGSTEVARLINRTLAAKDGPIVPLIAETGGLNGMFVDTTALKEQVVDDVIISAFNSAGQRCSSLRILFLPNETADERAGNAARRDGHARLSAIPPIPTPTSARSSTPKPKPISTSIWPACRRRLRC